MSLKWGLEYKIFDKFSDNFWSGNALLHKVYSFVFCVSESQIQNQHSEEDILQYS